MYRKGMNLQLNILKTDFSYKIKQEFFQAVAMSVILYVSTTLTYETPGEKARWELHMDATCISAER